MTAVCFCPTCGYQMRSPTAQGAIAGIEMHMAAKHPAVVTLSNDQRYTVAPSGTKH